MTGGYYWHGGFCIVCGIPLFVLPGNSLYCELHAADSSTECEDCGNPMLEDDVNWCSFCYKKVCPACWDEHWEEDAHVAWSGEGDYDYY